MYSCYGSLFLYAYGNVRSRMEEAERRGHHVESLAFSLLNSIPPALDPIRAIVLAHSSTVHVNYNSLLTQHPDVALIVQQAALLGMYTGSVVCAMSSAEHYGAVDKKHIVTVTRILVSSAVVPFIALMRLDDGAVWNDLVCNAWEGLASFAL